MKLVCVIISFTYFVNVSTLDQRKYKEEMYITNHQLKLIDKDSQLNRTNESKVDKLVVHLLFSNLPIVDMVILLATPDFYGEDLKTRCEIERKLQTVIQSTNVNVHEPPIKNINFDKIELSNFGDVRRDMIYPSLKRILVDVERSTVLDLDPLRVCHLIALLKSSLDPGQRIKEVNYDSDGCTLVSVLDRKSYYKQYPGGIYNLNALTGEKGDKLGIDLV
ncbi:uncharacterized protein LOC126841222 isoform X2 [Adelges cooleyi]|uniref:uncharacterized protein LOC126841222 isoform X2 n=1 Tax=Adelges cooleyi TaxID=133065 RepID=UPI00217FB598|nr:uncharacterized protein LOC126841222 isoform X2 [Adelges cooleyi]